MKVAVLVAVIALGGCDRRKDRDRSPPAPPVLAPLDLPDPHTVDWGNLVYDLGSLGSVKVTAGRAQFHVVEDELGVHALQGTAPAGDWPGFLEIEDPAYVDLDGDGHDEVVIPFELKSAHLDDVPHVFGVYVCTLRDGRPVQLATLTTPTKHGFTLAGATIVIEGATWRWDRARRALVTP